MRHTQPYIPFEDPYTPQALEIAQGLVTSKFDEAINSSQEAYDAALSYITALKSVISAIELPVVDDVEITYEPAEPLLQVLEKVPSYDEIQTLLSEIESLSVDITRPEYDTLPHIDEINFTSTIEGMKDWFLEQKTYETGISDAEEENVWNNSLRRLQDEVNAAYTEANTYFSSRGFSLPPGALVGKLTEIQNAYVRAVQQQTFSVSAETVKIKQAHRNAMLTEGWKFMQAFYDMETKRRVEYRESKIKEFIADMEKVKLEISKYVSELDGRYKAISAATEAIKAFIAAADVEIRAEIAFKELEFKKAIAETEVKLKAVDLQLETAKQIFAIEVESNRGAMQVSSQLAASAISSVNASAAVTANAQASNSTSHGIQSSYNDSDQYSESTQKIQTI